MKYHYYREETINVVDKSFQGKAVEVCGFANDSV